MNGILLTGEGDGSSRNSGADSERHRGGEDGGGADGSRGTAVTCSAVQPLALSFTAWRTSTLCGSAQSLPRQGLPTWQSTRALACAYGARLPISNRKGALTLPGWEVPYCIQLGRKCVSFTCSPVPLLTW